MEGKKTRDDKRGIILEKYCSSGKKVHINHSNGMYYNGVVIEVNCDEELIIFDELKLGEMFIEFGEIVFPISLYRERKE